MRNGERRRDPRVVWRDVVQFPATSPPHQSKQASKQALLVSQSARRGKPLPLTTQPPDLSVLSPAVENDRASPQAKG
ncbi:uncharacterized protein K460DRAFT_370079 [Cucurbitaria berberidis CBS 394.84]|uniref:Uncharacterized protein n=1 Tax=Cucurbitaria berberidis CBS 394.84 TaxID=1168544 RepID=A0A9P4L5K4_9PLEO|nr:uncharacterized protein K460DRAFT_370079 [Cucurbitaria berberidis CBS 394.84]KAF1842078.1 hypothetical protein K460DRAFT_370079 [Cucurbitaria berberidis CBS 394.84]